MSRINKILLVFATVVGIFLISMIVEMRYVKAQTCSGSVSVNQDRSSCAFDPIYGFTCNYFTETETPSCQWDDNFIPGDGFPDCGRWWFTCFAATCGGGLPFSCSAGCQTADTEWYSNGCTVSGGPTNTPTPTPTPTPPPPPPCSGIIAPSNPTTSNLTSTSVRLNWSPGSGGTTQLLRLGPNRTEVETGCPGGVGPGLGCLVGTSLALGTSTYNTGSILTPNTTYYWRIAEYNGANGDYKDFGNICKIASSVSFVTPLPSCNLSFNPPSVDLPVGEIGNVAAIVVTNPPANPIDRVDFSIDVPAIASIVPGYETDSDPLGGWTTQVLANSPGNTVLRAFVYMGGVLTCGGAAPVDPINVSNANAWWQVVNGDVIVDADIRSPIPASCTLPVCDPAFVVTPTGGYPGIPSFGLGNVFDVSAGIPPGTVSSTGWLAQASYSAQTDYNYAFFERLVPGDTVRNTIATPVIAPNALKDIWETNYPNNLSPDGYVWAFRNGDLTMRGEPTLGARKIVLFVDGNLTIGDGTTTGNIDITPGTGFFMAVVSGNITVHQEVRNPPGPASPELEGIFVANGNFTTASGGPATDDPIQIRGMVAAYGQVDPNRDLPDNSRTPAELFEYAPDLLFNMPPSLQLKRTRWKEVAP